MSGAAASATNRCARAISVFVGLVFAVTGALVVDSSICAHMGQQIVSGAQQLRGCEKHTAKWQTDSANARAHADLTHGDLYRYRLNTIVRWSAVVSVTVLMAVYCARWTFISVSDTKA